MRVHRVTTDMSFGRVAVAPGAGERDFICGLLVILIPEKSLLWKKGRARWIQRGQLEEIGRRLEVAKHSRGCP